MLIDEGDLRAFITSPIAASASSLSEVMRELMPKRHFADDATYRVDDGISCRRNGQIRLRLPPSLAPPRHDTIMIIKHEVDYRRLLSYAYAYAPTLRAGAQCFSY